MKMQCRISYFKWIFRNVTNKLISCSCLLLILTQFQSFYSTLHNQKTSNMVKTLPVTVGFYDSPFHTGQTSKPNLVSHSQTEIYLLYFIHNFCSSIIIVKQKGLHQLTKQQVEVYHSTLSRYGLSRYYQNVDNKINTNTYCY